MGSSASTGPVFGKKELNALASYQSALGNITSLRASQAGARITREGAERDLGILGQRESVNRSLFNIQEQAAILSRDKQFSDLQRQAEIQSRRIMPRQPTALLQLDDIISETERRASFINQQNQMQLKQLFTSRDLQNISTAQTALGLQDRIAQATVAQRSAAYRAEQTLLGAQFRLSAAESILD